MESVLLFRIPLVVEEKRSDIVWTNSHQAQDAGTA